MNIDIRLSLGFFDHPKTMKLAKRCGMEAVICLQRLWMWAAEQRPSGVLTGMDDEDIELAAKWQGEEGKFTRTLIDLHWLDEEEGQFILHGWDEHQAYASKSEERHSSAKKAAEIRWEKKRIMQGQCGSDAEAMRGACDAQCGNDATSCDAHANSNAPKHQDTSLFNTPLSTDVDIPPRGEQPAKKRRKEEPPRQAYGQFQQVMLTEDEHSKLEAEFGIKGAQDMIDRLDGYIASKGVKYKNHYATIMNWHRKDVKEEQQQQAQVPALSQGVPRFSNYGQQVKWDQQQQARALLAVGDKYKDNPEDLPPEWR